MQQAAEILTAQLGIDRVDDKAVWHRAEDPSRPRTEAVFRLKPGRAIVLTEWLGPRPNRKTVRNSLRLIVEQPGPVATRLISLTPGFQLMMYQSWHEIGTANHAVLPKSDSTASRYARPASHRISTVAAAPRNEVIYRIVPYPAPDAASAGETVADHGHYLLYIWQPDVPQE